MTDTPAIRIVGTGPVSLALRGLLLRQGFGAHELACDPPADTLPPWLARRAMALSAGSWQLLSRIAALPPSAPILTVDVSLASASGRTRLSAAELGVPALGHVVQYDALHEALSAPLRTDPPAATISPVSSPSPSPFSLRPSPPQITVIADGNPGEDSRQLDFEQAAVLATLRSSASADGVAFERFTGEGPLALLPLPRPRCWSLVWCAPPPRARQRAELPADAFATALRAAFGPRLGEFELLDAPIVATLQRRLRTEIVRGTEVAIGNAAQALHPVAGQGLNLGLRDAFVLAEQLGAARARGARLATALPGFARARRTDRLATVAVTDTLATIFGALPLRPLQSLALNLLEVAGPARRALARAFMFGPRA